MPTYVTSHEAQITAAVAGVTLPAVTSWSTWEGGDPAAETGQLLPGNTMKAVATPGPIKTSPLTLERPYTVELHNLLPQIKAAINGGMQASYTPTDADGNPNGNTETRTGLLKGLKIPKWDPEQGKVPPLGFIMECDS